MKTLLLISGILLLIESIVLFYYARAWKNQLVFIDRFMNPYMLNELLKYTRVARPNDQIIQVLEDELNLQPGEELEIKLTEHGK